MALFWKEDGTRTQSACREGKEEADNHGKHMACGPIMCPVSCII